MLNKQQLKLNKIKVITYFVLHVYELFNLENENIYLHLLTNYQLFGSMVGTLSSILI